MRFIVGHTSRKWAESGGSRCFTPYLVAWILTFVSLCAFFANLALLFVSVQHPFFRVAAWLNVSSVRAVALLFVCVEHPGLLQFEVFSLTV